jgi:hypothetical protein
MAGKKLPKLIQGIHPFDGMTYVSEKRDLECRRMYMDVTKTVEILRYAILEAGVPVPQVDQDIPDLDRLHLSALTMIMEEEQVEIPVIPYIELPLELKGKKLDPKRMFATYDQHNLQLGGKEYRNHFLNDPIVHYRAKSRQDIITCDKARPYSNEELNSLEINGSQFERNIGFFKGFKILIPDIGANADLLAMTGHLDLLKEGLRELKREFGAVVLSIHHAGASIPPLEDSGLDYDGYITPVNRLGAVMFPTRDAALQAIGEAAKPTIAIKPQAGGRDLGEESFRYVFDTKGVIACMVGLGTLEETQETLAAARKALDLS